MRCHELNVGLCVVINQSVIECRAGHQGEHLSEWRNVFRCDTITRAACQGAVSSSLIVFQTGNITNLQKDPQNVFTKLVYINPITIGK